MGEITNAMRRAGKYGIHIMRYPSGRYGLVGSVPAALMVPDPSNRVTLGAMKSMTWNSEAEALAAVAAWQASQSK